MQLSEDPHSPVTSHEVSAFSGMEGGVFSGLDLSDDMQLFHHLCQEALEVIEIYESRLSFLPGGQAARPGDYNRQPVQLIRALTCFRGEEYGPGFKHFQA